MKQAMLAVGTTTLSEWRERIRVAASRNTPLRLEGGNSKAFYGQAVDGETLDTRAYAGIIDYDPTELVVTARCGTPLSEVERTLAEARQMLPFEPPHFRGRAGEATATLGGCVAAGLSGPRRPYGGAVRDVVLGVRVLDGRGEDLSFGGRVIKNVAGFDVSRLMAGSLGTLGIIAEASLKCVPVPPAEATRVYTLPPAEALTRVNEWGGKPLPITATCHLNGRLHVRFSGAETAIQAAAERLGGEALPDAAAFWDAIRDHRHPFFAAAAQGGGALWRLSVRSTAPPAELGGVQMVEWGGALRWIAGPDLDAPMLRAWAREHGGHATLFRGRDRSAGTFAPLPPALFTLHQRLKASFDPSRILNRGRMYAEL